MPNPITHFEIPADDLQRAIKFYEQAPRDQALGWEDLRPRIRTRRQPCRKAARIVRGSGPALIANP